MQLKVVGLVLVLTLALAPFVVMGGGGGGDEDMNAPDADVITLTADNFDDIVRGEDLMIVEFYAPWCGHCKRLKPEFAKAATDLLANDPPVKLGKVDATVHGALAQKYKVNGYPKLFMFRNGRESDYLGPRDHKGIVDYVKKQVGPAAKPLANAAELARFTTLDRERDFVTVGFFQKGSKSQLHSSFVLTAAKLREDYFFGIVHDDKLAAEAGVTLNADGEAVVAFKNYDDKKSAYSGSYKTQALQDWIIAQSLAVVSEFTQQKSVRYQKRALPVLKYYMKVDRSAANAKMMSYYTNRLEALAKEFDGKIVVAIANVADFAQAMDEYGLKGKAEGVVIEGHPDLSGRARKYKFDGAFKADKVQKWVADFVAGRVEQYIKSEEAPLNNDAPVKIATGRNFKQLVADDKDVLIEFYAPWCGHCKTLAPKYEKLAKKFKGVDSVVIAKMDATANDIPVSDYNVQGFPTIYFKPAGGKPISFEGGEREVADFVKFIKKHSKTKWRFRQ